MGSPTGARVLEAIHRAIELYNTYRSPEARCTLEAFENGKMLARFEGHFCMTCGVVDWIEDLIYILRDFGVEASISRIWYHNDEGYVLVEIVIGGYSAEGQKPVDIG